MIKINSSGNIEIKDTKPSLFKIEVDCIKDDIIHSTEHQDLNPEKFLPGGSNSTGMFIIDMSAYVTDTFNSMIKSLPNNAGISIKDIKDIANGGFSKIDLKGVFLKMKSLWYSTDFEENLVGRVSGPLMFRALFTNDISFNEDIFYNDSSKQYECNLSKMNQEKSADEIIELLFRIYMFSYSQCAREQLYAYAYNKIVSNASGGLEFVDIDIFDRYIDDTVRFRHEFESSSSPFLAKYAYGLSKSNSSTASRGYESLSVIDEALLSQIRIYSNGHVLSTKNLNNIVTTTRTHSRFLNNDNDNDFNIFTINAYKAVSNDCLISASLTCKYNNLPTEMSNLLTMIFNKTGRVLVSYEVSRLIDSSAINLKHEDIVFDFPINELVQNNKVSLELVYTSYTSSGGARYTEYKDLATRKISPVSRRDELHKLCCHIFNVCEMDITLGFSKLNVDFKRFYGYLNN